MELKPTMGEQPLASRDSKQQYLEKEGDLLTSEAKILKQRSNPTPRRSCLGSFYGSGECRAHTETGANEWGKPTSKQSGQANHSPWRDSSAVSCIKYVLYSPCSQDFLSHKSGERKITTDKREKNQEGWLITTDRKLIILVMTVQPSLASSWTSPSGKTACVH